MYVYVCVHTCISIHTSFSVVTGEVGASGRHHADLLCKEGTRRVHIGGGGGDCGHWDHGKDGE